MMMPLLILKSKIKNFYEKNYRIVRCILKMIFSFLAFYIITGELDYSDTFGQFWLLLMGAVVCGLTPDVVTACGILFFMCAEIAQVSVLLAVAILVIVIIYFLIFGRLAGRQSYLVFSIPLLSVLHLEYAVPAVAALFASPAMIPALIMGILLQFIIKGVSNYVAAAAGAADTGNVLVPLRYLFDYLLKNPLFIVTVLAFCLTFLCAYVIRKGKFKHGFQIAILVGTLILMTIELLSNIILELNMNLLLLTMRVIVSMVIAYVIQFFYITLDYHGTRKLQFEDDEYYYYVTAVPKFKVAVVDKTVTRIAPGEEGETFDLKEELEKALEEEKMEAKSD